MVPLSGWPCSIPASTLLVESNPAIQVALAAFIPARTGDKLHDWGWPLLLTDVALASTAIAWFRKSIRQEEIRTRIAAEERDRLAERLAEMSVALERAAQGDLAVQLDTEGINDAATRALAESFDETLKQLRILVGEAQSNGERLNQAAAELRAAAGQQADSASMQSSAVTETTATVEELAATAAHIADSSRPRSRRKVSSRSWTVIPDGSSARSRRSQIARRTSLRTWRASTCDAAQRSASASRPVSSRGRSVRARRLSSRIAWTASTPG